MTHATKLGLALALLAIVTAAFFLRLSRVPPATVAPDEVKLAALRAERLIGAMPEQGGRALVLSPTEPGGNTPTPGAQSFIGTLEKAAWQLEVIAVPVYSDEQGNVRYEVDAARLDEAIKKTTDAACLISLVGGSFLYDARARIPPKLKVVVADNPEGAGLENRALFKSGKAHLTFALREDSAIPESTGDKLADWFSMNYELVGSLR